MPESVTHVFGIKCTLSISKGITTWLAASPTASQVSSATSPPSNEAFRYRGPAFVIGRSTIVPSVRRTLRKRDIPQSLTEAVTLPSDHLIFPRSRQLCYIAIDRGCRRLRRPFLELTIICNGTSIDATLVCSRDLMSSNWKFNCPPARDAARLGRQGCNGKHDDEGPHHSFVLQSKQSLDVPP